MHGYVYVDIYRCVEETIQCLCLPINYRYNREKIFYYAILFIYCSPDIFFFFFRSFSFKNIVYFLIFTEIVTPRDYQSFQYRNPQQPTNQLEADHRLKGFSHNNFERPREFEKEPDILPDFPKQQHFNLCKNHFLFLS